MAMQIGELIKLGKTRMEIGDEIRYIYIHLYIIRLNQIK